MEEQKKDVLILAIETSCDETAAAVVKNGREVLSNTIYTQIKLHTMFGGVVPEIASRKHIEKINIVIETALKEADVTLEDIDAIAVTYGPGLVGALLVGVAEAKALAYAAKKPLVGVHHIEGHISANYIEHKELEPPFLCMVASGGHSHLVLVKGYGEYEIIGRTRDDAAGEAFDKVARAIGLGYPGGPKIDKLAKEGNKKAIAFPRAKITDAPDDFSFSGETVVKLSLKKDTPKIEVTMEPDEESNYTPQEKATYSKIKEYVKDKYGVNVHTSYIAQVKRMCGLDMGENYNKSKKGNLEVKKCPQEKVEYIKDAMRHFNMI